MVLKRAFSTVLYLGVCVLCLWVCGASKTMLNSVDCTNEFVFLS